MPILLTKAFGHSPEKWEMIGMKDNLLPMPTSAPLLVGRGDLPGLMPSCGYLSWGSSHQPIFRALSRMFSSTVGSDDDLTRYFLPVRLQETFKNKRCSPKGHRRCSSGGVYY